MRKCSICGKMFPATTEYFYKCRDKLRGQCKLCYKIKRDEYRYKHMNEYNQWAKNRYDPVKRKEYYGKVREEVSIKYKKDYKNNPEKYLERGHKYRRTPVGYLRSIYTAIQTRTSNPKCDSYNWYTSRGIKCMFKSPTEFVTYCLKTFTNISFIGSECHRIDNTKGYKPGNITFIDKGEHYAIHKQLRLR